MEPVFIKCTILRHCIRIKNQVVAMPSMAKQSLSAKDKKLYSVLYAIIVW